MMVLEKHLLLFSLCFSRASLASENHRLPFLRPLVYFLKNRKIQVFSIYNCGGKIKLLFYHERKYAMWKRG
jgi:hypothetical protein